MSTMLCAWAAGLHIRGVVACPVVLSFCSLEVWCGGDNSRCFCGSAKNLLTRAREPYASNKNWPNTFASVFSKACYG
jgi:hypothetical protein